MSDTPEKKPASLSELRELRTYFAAEAAKANEKVAGVDKLIAEAEQAEREAAREAALSVYLPEEGKGALNGHDFVFMANNTKEGGRGPDSLLGAQVAAAHKLHTALCGMGITSATVKQQFWGGNSLGNTMDLNSRFGASAYNDSHSEAHKLLPAAKYILNACTPDQATDRATHYVLLGGGDIAEDVEVVANVLEAAAKLNPKATFDIVVCSNKSITGLENLAHALQSHGVKAGLTKVFAPKQIDEAVAGLVKSRLKGDAPPVATAAPRKAAKKAPKKAA